MKSLLIILKGGRVMRRSVLIALPLFVFCLLLCSCTNVQKQYDKGNYKTVIDTVAKKTSPSQNDLLLQTKSYVNLGDENKALESALLYLLAYDGKDEQGRAYAVKVFLDTDTSDRVAVLVLDRNDGIDARIALFKAYSNLGDEENARQILDLLSSEMVFSDYMTLLLENPVSDDYILEVFTAWYANMEETDREPFLSYLARFSSEISITETVAWKFLSLTDVLMADEFYNSDDKRLSAVLKIKGNILESLFDKVNARIYWSQAYNLNPDDEELRNKLQ